jgi:threonine dehydrogenase-like Zn-dependent dehydrogenase
MRAVVFDLSIPKYVAAKALGKRFPALYDGAPSCLSLRDDVARPVLPGEGWLRLRPILSGVCGTDLSIVYFKQSMTLTPYASFPFVLGHEVLARVSEVGPGVRELREGDRVVIDPWLRCDLRGVPACARCAVGEYATCETAASGPNKGVLLGMSAAFPGGWGEEMVAHESQCFTIGDGVSDERAVLAEPLAVGVHAVLRHMPQPGERVLVIGGGAIAYSVIFGLEETAEGADVTVLTLEDAQARMAETLGAERAWTPKGEPVVERAAALTGAKVLKPEMGPRYLCGGFDRVFDCVGTAQSIRDAFNFVRGGGTVVMVGAPGVLPKIDLTHLWNKEVRWVGTMAYAWDSFRGERRRTFDVTRELLTGTRSPIEKLVTHQFALDDYQEALRANLDRGKTGAIKTVLRSAP